MLPHEVYLFVCLFICAKWSFVESFTRAIKLVDNMTAIEEPVNNLLFKNCHGKSNYLCFKFSYTERINVLIPGHLFFPNNYFVVLKKTKKTKHK